MTILFAILLFSFLIFIHEFGHFITAKLFGVQVNEFSMFMGPAIFKKQKGETLYSIRCIPFGGYCAMEGEDGESDNPKAFGRAKWWKRLIILVAGSFMNLVAGFLLLFIVNMPAEQVVLPQIESFSEFCTIDGEKGLQAGDVILEVDGEAIYTPSDLQLVTMLHPGDVHDVLILRGEEEILLDNFLMEKHLVTDDGVEKLQYGLTFTVVEADLGMKLKTTWYDCLDTVRTVRVSLQMLLSGQAGLQDMTGPVGLVDFMSQTAAASPSTSAAIFNLLYLGGFIAINLAVMNLLPIPALDGGRAVCLLITTAVEKITKKKVNPKFEGWLHGVGMILLLLLMAVILFKDIFTIFTR